MRIGARQGTGVLAEQIARTIDHTLLKPEATSDEVRKLCAEAHQHGFASVCLNPAFVPLARSILAGSTAKVVAVVGFPLGASSPAAKAYEACEAVRQGADEIDMVLNIGALKEGDYRLVAEDIRGVVEASRPAPVKVILETCKLTDEEKVAACTLSKVAGAAYVKTSTGFGGGGATVEDVALMRRVVGPALGVKASGGVKTRDQAEAMIAAGATRIGASASVAIVSGRSDSGKGY
ncbi:MAG: deoxyribose-phosphate aldolase [Deltaproteobacteria bacterium]|nr:deoxyribose-phosphate aldolase [Deltaproteobacteria bacterium]